MRCFNDAGQNPVTTSGFEDVLVIGRQARPELYNLNAQNPPELVPDDLRFGR